MSNLLQLTKHLRYEPKDTMDLITEFNQLFSSFKSQVKKFILTQPTFLQEIRNQVKSEIGFLPPQQKNVALAVYGIIVAEDVLQEYSPSQYANDISFLLEATDKKNKCTDDEFIGIISSYINALNVSQKATKAVINGYIELKSMEIADDIISAFLIRRYYYPVFSEIIELFEVAEFQIDIRWITALFAYSLENILLKEQEKATRSISNIYREIMRIYPSCDGLKYVFDLAYEFLIKKYFAIVEKTFKQRAELKKIEKGVALKESGPIKEKTELEKTQERIMQLLAVLEKPVTETLKFNKNFDDQKRQTLETNIESSLKRLALSLFNVQDIIDTEKYLSVIFESWFKLFLDWPQMVVPIINLTAYSKFLSDPVSYITKQKNEIIRQLQFKIRRQIGGERMTPGNLAEAFSRIIYEILNNSSVKTLTL